MAEKRTDRNQLILVCGLSFAGKSTLGKEISDRFGYEEVDVDESKFRLYGREILDEELRPEEWVRIYAETDRLIETILQAGRTVVDASRNFSRGEREIARSIAERAGVPLLTIYVDTPEDIVRRRMLENRRNPSRRDISDADFEDVIRAMEAPPAAEDPLIFHYFDEIESWISGNRERLAPNEPSNRAD